MPVGPSHGGRSGGGSHVGGFGGSHGGGGPRGGGPRPSPSSSFVNGMIGGMIGASIANSRRERFERRYGVRPTDEEYNSMPRRTKPTGFLILSIVVAFFMICTIVPFSGVKGNISYYKEITTTMEEDWTDYYKPMLDSVKSDSFSQGTNGYYTTTAEFSKQKISYYDDNPTKPAYYLDFEKDGVYYYFIVYEYEDEDNKEHTGTTYTQFSANQIQTKAGEIAIAYYNKNGEHYSINLDYNLETCAEYIHYQDLIESNKQTIKGVITALVIEILVLALFITLYFLKVKKYYKLVAQDEELLFQKKKAELNETKSKSNKFCRYCGSKLEANATKCPSCGANLIK